MNVNEIVRWRQGRIGGGRLDPFLAPEAAFGEMARLGFIYYGRSSGASCFFCGADVENETNPADCCADPGSIRSLGYRIFGVPK